MPLRQLHRRARHGAAEDQLCRPVERPVPDVQADPKMLNVEQVGAYAMRIDWSDGHSTGIYSFDYLRRICPCRECQSQTALA